MGCVVTLLGAVVILIKIAWDDAVMYASDRVAKEIKKRGL